MLLTSKLSLAPLLRGLVEVLVLLDDIGGRPIGPQLALLDPQCAVARVLDRAHRVGDEEDGAGVLADRPDPALRTVTELLVADVERLVDDEDLVLDRGRSEERRVGKECSGGGARWGAGKKGRHRGEQGVEAGMM